MQFSRFDTRCSRLKIFPKCWTPEGGPCQQPSAGRIVRRARPVMSPVFRSLCGLNLQGGMHLDEPYGRLGREDVAEDACYQRLSGSVCRLLFNDSIYLDNPETCTSPSLRSLRPAARQKHHELPHERPALDQIISDHLAWTWLA